MDFDTTVADEAEQYLKQREAAPTDDPQAGECLRCYVDRMVAVQGCDNTMRFSTRWLESAQAPNARQLIRWLESRGGYCDCEVVMNALPGHWPERAP